MHRTAKLPCRGGWNPQPWDAAQGGSTAVFPKKPTMAFTHHTEIDKLHYHGRCDRASGERPGDSTTKRLATRLPVPPAAWFIDEEPITLFRPRRAAAGCDFGSEMWAPDGDVPDPHVSK